MPGGDRTGPMGAGPMTGRGAGFCRGFNQPGYVSGRGGGFGRGFGGGGFGGGGFGRGRRNQFWATGLPGWARNQNYDAGAAYYRAPEEGNFGPGGDVELAAVRQQLADIGTALENINRRLDDLEKRG